MSAGSACADGGVESPASPPACGSATSARPVHHVVARSDGDLFEAAVAANRTCAAAGAGDSGRDAAGHDELESIKVTATSHRCEAWQWCPGSVQSLQGG